MKLHLLILLALTGFACAEDDQLIKVGFPKTSDDHEVFCLVDENSRYIVVSDSSTGKIWKSGVKEKKFSEVLGNIKVVKTFGGMPPRIPVKLVGNNIAYCITTRDESLYQLNGNIPLAYAVTILATMDGIEIDRSIEYLYDHNPWLCIKNDWLKME